jgi:hypothetical protein
VLGSMRIFENLTLKKISYIRSGLKTIPKIFSHQDKHIFRLLNKYIIQNYLHVDSASPRHEVVELPFHSSDIVGLNN